MRSQLTPIVCTDSRDLSSQLGERWESVLDDYWSRQNMGANIKLCIQQNPGVFRLTLKDGLPADSRILVVVDDWNSELNTSRDILRAYLLDESFRPVGSTPSLRLEVGGFDAQVEAQELRIVKIPENSLECAACRTTTADVQALRVHYREHIADGTLSCSYCEIPFGTLASFKEHLQLHEEKDKREANRYEAPCDQCEMKFSSVKGLASHRRKHVLERKFAATDEHVMHISVQKTEGPATVRRLLEERKTPADQNKANLIICARCGEVFHSKTKFDAHILKMHPESLNDRCPQCEKVFLSASLLRSHILERHSVHFACVAGTNSALEDQTEFECNYCQATFSEPAALLDHCSMDHPERLKSFECPNCAKKFCMEKRYLNHMLSKSNECGKRPACTVCSKFFSSTKSLRDHMRAVHPESESPTRLLRCGACNEGYATKSALRYHVKAKHGIERHPCSVCDKTFALSVQRIRHERRVHQKEEKLFSCNLCERSFFTSRELLQHLLNGHKVVPSVNEHGQAILPDGTVGPTMKYYACEYCPMTTYSRKTFIRHRVNHTGIWPFTCEVCAKGFSERFQALKHVRRRHALTSDSTLFCPQCPRVFVDDASFGTHLNTHKYLTGKACALCHKLYETEHALENHASIAHNIPIDERYGCEYCHREFGSKHLLREHKASGHNLSKSLHCALCTRSFRRKMDLRFHVYTKCRLAKPPRTCVLCQSTFRNPHLFKIHLRSHRSHKPFSCSICQKTFMFFSSLSKHLKHVHGLGHQKARTIIAQAEASSFSEGLSAVPSTSFLAPSRDPDVSMAPSPDLLGLAEIAGVIEVDHSAV